MTKVEFETSEEVDVTPTFDTMGLREDLLRGIYAYGRGPRAGRAGARPGGSPWAPDGRPASGTPRPHRVGGGGFGASSWVHSSALGPARAVKSSGAGESVRSG